MEKENFTNSSASEKDLIEKIEQIDLNKEENSGNDGTFSQKSFADQIATNLELISNSVPFESFNLAGGQQFSQNKLNSTNCSSQFLSQSYLKPFSLSNTCKEKVPVDYSTKIKALEKINQGDDETLPVVSVIVTLFSGSSYDDLFRSVKQVAPEGRVSLYSASLDSIDQLLKALKGELSTDDELKKTADDLLKDIESVEPDCVLFNWECCSGCGLSFPQTKNTMEMLKLLIDRHYMTMFSDFALKSLIIDWDESLLGSNPFIKLGECTSQIKLKFKPDVLKDCPSSQLKMVGQLCEKGEAVLHALAQTIVFSVDSTKIDPARYQLQVLTIVTQTKGFINENKSNLYEIDGEKGPVGHAMIKFNNGGILLVSAGHWVELSKLDVNVTQLENVAEKYGAAYSQQVNSIKNSQESEYTKSQQYNVLANKFVQQCAPCNYSQKSVKKDDK